MSQAKQVNVRSDEGATHLVDTTDEGIGFQADAMHPEDADLESWLQNVGGPIYDRMQANPSSGIPAEEVLRRIEMRRPAEHKIA